MPRSQLDSPTWSTLGVVGGMGPLAAVKFLENLLRVTPVASEREHIRVLLDNDPRLPDRLAAYRGTGVSPSPAIRLAIEALASQGAQAIAVPCNAVHYFRSEIADSLPVPWLDMIEMVGTSVAARAARPLVLGAYITVRERLYDPFLPGCVYPSDELNGVVYAAIERLKLVPAASVYAQPLVEKLRDLLNGQDCDAILLSCTELSLLHDLPGLEVPVIDGSIEYARLIVASPIAACRG